MKILCSIFGKCVKNIVVRWSLTQNMSLYQQLAVGVRYLDMRTCHMRTTNSFYTVHGVCGNKTSTLFADVLRFLREHPKEVIILDFNHFYNFNDTLHEKFVSYLKVTFMSKLLMPGTEGADISLNEIWKNQGRIIIFYGNQLITDKHKCIWPSESLFSPWPNTSSVPTLISSLNSRFSTLRPCCFNVFQCVLTPQTSDFVNHFRSSLKSYLGLRCDAAVSDWLKKVYDARKKGVNIIMCDFVDTDKVVEETLKLNAMLKLQ